MTKYGPNHCQNLTTRRESPVLEPAEDSGMPLPRDAVSGVGVVKVTGPNHRGAERVKETRENNSPVAEVEAPAAEIEDIDSAPEAALFAGADALEAAVASPALAAVFPPATTELAAAVAPVEAGQDAADGNATLTLCRIIVNLSTFCISCRRWGGNSGEIQVLKLTYHIIEQRL